MNQTLEFPEYAWKEGTMRPTIEVSIDFLPNEFRGNWHGVVLGYTADFVKKSKFNKKATLWMWGCMSANMISAHLQNPGPSWSDFIIQFGFPNTFVAMLGDKLKKTFKQQARLSEYLPARRDDGWTAICHVEQGIVWKPDDPDHWIPFVQKIRARHRGEE